MNVQVKQRSSYMFKKLHNLTNKLLKQHIKRPTAPCNTVIFRGKVNKSMSQAEWGRFQWLKNYELKQLFEKLILLYRQQAYITHIQQLKQIHGKEACRKQYARRYNWSSSQKVILYHSKIVLSYLPKFMDFKHHFKTPKL